MVHSGLQRYGAVLPRVSRRDFLRLLPPVLCLSRNAVGDAQGSTGVHFSVLEYERFRIVENAKAELACKTLVLADAPLLSKQQEPDKQVLRSSRIDPFQMRAKEENSDNEPFLKQIDLLATMTARVSTLTAAWRLTQDESYFQSALKQLHSWCLDPSTRMLPTLEHVGTLDTPADDARINGMVQTVCLADLARAAAFLCASPKMPPDLDTGLRAWFADVLTWLNESPRGVIARDGKDLQTICWTAQAAELARFTRNENVFRECTHRFRDKLLRQMTLDGNFPPALQAKRPYAASMFTLECLGAACESLSTPFESQWNFTLPDGRGMRAAVAWAAPYLANKGKWPYVSDTHLFAEQPLRCNALLFAGRAWNRQDYIDLWKRLPPGTANEELRRERVITQPGLWAMRPPA